ncbi:hypothetical protein GCM10027614_36080 [Micromonospora vulcania]
MVRAVTAGPLPVRITGYDGSAVGPSDAGITLSIRSERGLSYLLTAPGDLGMARAYVSGDLALQGCTRATRTRRCGCSRTSCGCARRR